MKNNTKYNYQFLIGLVIVVLAITSCETENNFGIEVLPKDDLISVKKVILKDDISSYTFNEKLIETDEATKSLLGSLNESTFGVSEINFAAQFRLQFFPDFGENPVADSVRLILRYRKVYGDTITAQTFRVYELESALDIDAEYFQDVDLKSMASDFLLGETYYTPQITTDSAETQIYQQIFAIPLDKSLAERLVNADSSQLVNNEVFLEFFKGLYIETESQSIEGGAILSLDAISSDSYLGSGLVVYYNNDENKAATEPDTLFMPFLISANSARVNNMSHDYSGTPFEENLNSELVEDSLIYVQSTGGLRSRILIDNLSTWKDSVNIAINKAELIFQVDTIASDIHNFFPPTQMLFTVVDKNGDEFLPIDYVFNPEYYGGGLRSDYTYHFNITQHLQQIIDGTAENYGFYLTPANKNSEANRTVLKGSRSTTGIKLVITYSKFTI